MDPVQRYRFTEPFSEIKLRGIFRLGLSKINHRKEVEWG